MSLYKKPALTILAILLVYATASSAGPVPDIHANIKIDSSGQLYYVTAEGDTLWELSEQSDYTLDQLRQNPVGSDRGLRFDFQNENLNGSIHYGMIDMSENNYIFQPVYKGQTARIENGRAEIDILKTLSGKYDFVGWEESGKMRLGYRIIDESGKILYDGKIMVRGTGPFMVDTSIVEGPLVCQVTPKSTVITFKTNYAARVRIEIGGENYSEPAPTTDHEIRIGRLHPDSTYYYYVYCGGNIEGYRLRTPPENGTRKPFTFAYASDSRAGKGGGERSMMGVNAYILKRIGSYCFYRDVRFMQFTGDLINGYSNSRGEIELEYANFKRTLEPYWSYFPIVPGMGNHESYCHLLSDGKKYIGIDKFPYKDNSSESIFAEQFANPVNGPESEDGASYDPDPNRDGDFPPYDETVYYYRYDNVGMIVLNSSYWYSFSVEEYPEVGGNLHAYLMDNQLQWLIEALEALEYDDDIDHVFVTLHTPIFPNGGHVSDDMWCDGNNEYRPWVSGKPLAKGIIERRDEILQILMKYSTKLAAVLTGDEHNYNRLKIDENTSIYPEGWDGPTIRITRPIFQINNGAAGAPYYGTEETPWMDHLEKFSTRNALVLFHVNGKEIEVEVVNPDTLEEVDRFKLR